MLKIFSFASMIGLACMGCFVHERNTSSKKEIIPQLHIKQQEDTTGRIVFLTFFIQSPDSAADKYSFRLTDSRLVNGIIKSKDNQRGMVIENNYLYIECSDKKNNRLEWIKVPDPLSTIQEFVENDGSLHKKLVKKQSGQLLVRFQYNEKAYYLSVYKPVATTLTLKKIYHAEL